MRGRGVEHAVDALSRWRDDRQAVRDSLREHELIDIVMFGDVDQAGVEIATHGVSRRHQS